MAWLTLADRKREADTRVLRAMEALRADLAAYAGTNGGRYIVYPVAGAFRPAVGILIDTAIVVEDGAWAAAEEISWRLGFWPDIRPLRWCSQRFINSVLRDAMIVR